MENENIFCYCDGSLKDDIGCATLIVKNQNDQIIHASISEIKKCKKSHITEARALANAFNFFLSNNYKNCNIKIYGDCEGVINVIKSSKNSKNIQLSNDIFENFSKLKKSNKITLQWVSRKKNFLADAFSKLPSRLQIKNVNETEKINDIKGEDEMAQNQIKDLKGLNGLFQNEIKKINGVQPFKKFDIKYLENLLNEIDNMLYYVGDIDSYTDDLNGNMCSYNRSLEDLDVILDSEKLSAPEISQMYSIRKEILRKQKEIKKELKLISLIPNDNWIKLNDILKSIKKSYEDNSENDNIYMFRGDIEKYNFKISTKLKTILKRTNCKSI